MYQDSTKKKKQKKENGAEKDGKVELKLTVS